MGGEELYILKHKDLDTAMVKINPFSGRIEYILEVYLPEELPVGCKKDGTGLAEWWNMRAVPDTRKGIQQALKILREETSQSLMLAAYGLSLTDHYWMQPVSKELYWRDINFFENDFSDELGNLLTDTGRIDVDDHISRFSPASSVNGEMKKKWIIRDHTRYLLKINTNNYGQQAVNEKIAENIPVVTKLMTLDEAKKSGAMALFGEKYGDTVRVVCVDDYSKEFCGGTHVSNTGEIQAFKILSESGVAAGVRRIEALTGQGVFDYYNDLEKKLEEAAKTVKATPANLQEKLEHLMADLKSLQAENESLKSKAAKEALGDVMDQVQDVNGVKLLAVSVADVDMNGLRDLGDQLKEKLGEGVVVLASAKDGKVNLIAMATDAAMKQGAHAGNLIKGIAALVGGGGGGRPNMAQAGGKNPAGIDAAIAEAAKVLAGQIDK